MGVLASPADNLASFALTHVYYDPASHLGLPAAFLALVPQALLVAYVTALYCRREVDTAGMLAGQLSCEAVNWALKRIIKQERPQHVIGIGKGYGMPSSHAQFMGFFAVYATCLLLFPHRRSRTLVTTPASGSLLRSLRIATVVILSLAVCQSRIYLAYHTVSQVLVGATCGVLFGLAWFALVGRIRAAGIVDLFLETRLAALLLVKDTSFEDAIDEEWMRWRETRTVSKMHARGKRRHR